MPVNGILDYFPSIQEKLRLLGFHEYGEVCKITQYKLDIEAKGEKTAVNMLQRDYRSIYNSERSIALRIEEDSISVYFADYTNFAAAEDTYKKLLGAVEECIQGLFCKGFQLRYVNHIPLEGTESPAEWVIPAMLGLPNIGEMNRVNSVSETLLTTSAGGQLAVRCAGLSQGRTVSPDLLPLDIKLKSGLQCNTPFIILDLLHNQNIETETFTAQQCVESFSSLRLNLNEAFCSTVTPQALKSWQ